MQKQRFYSAAPVLSLSSLFQTMIIFSLPRTGAVANKINGRLAESMQEVSFLNKHIVSKIIHTPIVDKGEVGRAWLRLHQGLLSRLPGRVEGDKSGAAILGLFTIRSILKKKPQRFIIHLLIHL